MVVGLTVLAALVAIFGLFVTLNLVSRRTYRPSPGTVKQILEASIDGKLSLADFDEFSCVPIAYDARLDGIRLSFCKIVDDPSNSFSEISRENSTPLTEDNKARVRQLIQEVERFASEPRHAT
jgi:hypothetical protein